MTGCVLAAFGGFVVGIFVGWWDAGPGGDKLPPGNGP